MNYLKLTLITVFTLGLNSCDLSNNKPNESTGYALPGTETLVVGISVDKDGIPKETYKNIKLHPGQKVVFAGPDEFSIIFKDKKTPNRQIENKSSNGTVVIRIPDKIFEQPEFVAEFRKEKSLTFDYAISVNGKELDPPMIIVERGQR
jgi:hypothetical protein